MPEEQDNPSDQTSGTGGVQPEPLQLPELSDLDMLSSKILELEATVAQYKDQLLRKAAEFDNYKRRVEGESVNLVRFANEDLIEKILPVLDDLERFMKSAAGSKDAGGEQATLIRGIELIAAKFKKILEGFGVAHLEVVGKPFDPDYHDALLQLPNNTVAPGTILEEIEKGYMMHAKILRHARVVVAADQSGGSAPSETD
jgi:molecular chaperone GrpE